MNIINKLTIRHLRQNKKRTLVTIFGVIISVAMITAVTTIGTSFLDLMKRQEISADGEWHVLYKNVDAKQIDAIKKDGQTKSLSVTRNLGYANLDKTKIPSRPYMSVKGYDDFGFRQFNIELTEGRLPQNENEIVISKDIIESAGANYKIGDSITLNIGQRYSLLDNVPSDNLGQNYPFIIDDGKPGEKLVDLKAHNYTIVGMINPPKWEPTWGPGYSAFTYTDESKFGVNDKANVSVIVNTVNKSIYKHAEQLAQSIGIPQKQIEYNNQLLRYYGITNNSSLNMTIYSLTTIILSIIIIGSVSLIYNAFAISVAERSRHLGMLSSVGATRRQKRNSVFFEGAIIGLISIPLGIVSGLAGIGITFYFINSAIKQALDLTEGLKVTVTPFSMIVAIIVSAFTIFISSYLPAEKSVEGDGD
ncbi:ABC transporter permease [Paenibacillus sp. D2_2]|uniref:ABC transporter permease n=1 Tax=Paenibacillus sp. D2_2 TaxID=3073092 RepID=UPI002815D682|nr:ABC transporter permease [Paenibacillus sp. D2_2]WMT38799.1 ABC transporter permease [Paenibacillus sp. D2_2]